MRRLLIRTLVLFSRPLIDLQQHLPESCGKLQGMRELGPQRTWGLGELESVRVRVCIGLNKVSGFGVITRVFGSVVWALGFRLALSLRMKPQLCGLQTVCRGLPDKRKTPYS